jgi:hypothetical protein
LPYGFKCRLCGRVYASVEGVLTCLSRHGVKSGDFNAFIVRVPLQRVRRVDVKGSHRLEDYGGG